MKPHNQKHIVLSDMLGYKFLPHGVEEMQEGQLGTTIYDDDLKNWEQTQAKRERVQYK